MFVFVNGQLSGIFKTTYTVSIVSFKILLLLARSVLLLLLWLGSVLVMNVTRLVDAILTSLEIRIILSL